MTPERRKPAFAGLSVKRMKGLEPSTFCMASRRSSQLSYIRVKAEYSDGPEEPVRPFTKRAPLPAPAPSALRLRGSPR